MAFIPIVPLTSQSKLLSSSASTFRTTTLPRPRHCTKRPHTPATTTTTTPCASASRRGGGSRPNPDRRDAADGRDDADADGEAGPFQPFDGSRPLLPPWQPPTLEAAFSYRARGLSKRERGSGFSTVSSTSSPLTPPFSSSSSSSSPAAAQKKKEEEEERRLVRIESPGYATLYAQVLQDKVIRKAKHNNPPVGSDGSSTSASSDTTPDQQQEKQQQQAEVVRTWLRPLILDDPTGGFVDVRGTNDLVVPRWQVREVEDAELRTRLLVNLAATEGDVICRAGEVAGEEGATDDGYVGGAPAAAREALMRFVRRIGRMDAGAQDGGEQGRQ